MLILILLNNTKKIYCTSLVAVPCCPEKLSFDIFYIFKNIFFLFQDPFSPGKQELFSPPPLERFEPPQPQQPQQAQPASNGGNVVPQPQPAPTRNGLQNGFNGFVSSKVGDDEYLQSWSGLSTIDI